MTPALIKYPSNIVIGVDGSQDCLAGIELLKSLPCLPNCAVLALSVWSSRSANDRNRLEAALAEVRGLLEGLCAAVQTDLRQGHPAETLVQAAEERRADLITLGARGQRSALDILVGGVAQQVVEHAACPVLITRQPYSGLNRVLLAVDGSPCSQHAAAYLSAFNLPPGTQVDVVSVSPPPGIPGMGSGSWPVGHELVPVLSDFEIEELENLREEERAFLQARIDEASSLLQESGRETHGRLLEGDAANEIIQFARHQYCDLIVAGSRGLSAVRGWLMGSVSRKLVNFSGQSVLVVRGGAWCEREEQAQPGAPG